MDNSKKMVALKLEANDIEIVQELAAMHGLSFSAALRMIIREWARLTKAEPVKTTG